AGRILSPPQRSSWNGTARTAVASWLTAASLRGENMRHDCERVLSLTAWILLLPAFLLAEEADQRATTITADTIRQHVQVLASDTFEGREAGTRGGRAASIYLRQSLEKSGLGGGAA